MESVIKNWLSGTPEPWQLWVGFFVLVTLVFERVVTLRDSWFALREGRNRLLFEKQQLEILKLRYEIEVIRKINQLPEIHPTYGAIKKIDQTDKIAKRKSAFWKFIAKKSALLTFTIVILRATQVIVGLYLIVSAVAVVAAPIVLFSYPEFAQDKWFPLLMSLVYAAFAYGCYWAYRRLQQLVIHLRSARALALEETPVQ